MQDGNVYDLFKDVALCSSKWLPSRFERSLHNDTFVFIKRYRVYALERNRIWYREAYRRTEGPQTHQGVAGQPGLRIRHIESM